MIRRWMGPWLLCAVLAGCMNANTLVPGVHISGGPRQVSDVSATHAAELNALRARLGRAAIVPDARLAQVAAGHAEDMLQNRFFGHVSADGRTIIQRARNSGYGFCYVAENLALGQDSFGQVLQQWMESPSHRRNIEARRVDEFGLVRGPGNLWVLVMGRPGC